MKYRIVEEWSAPSYVDYKTGETLYESCSTEQQCYWAVRYDQKEQEVVEWVERFTNLAQAKEYLEKVNRGRI